MIFVHKSYISN